jgi:molecular chaperone HscA
MLKDSQVKEIRENSCCGGGGSQLQKNKISEEEILYLGIDFGTTNCLISYYDVKKDNLQPSLKFIKNQKTSCNFFPSIISIDQSGQYFFCSEGGTCQNNLKITKSIKRIIGLKLSEIKKILNELSFEIDFERSSEDEVFIFIGLQGHSRSVREIVLGMMSSLLNAIKESENIKNFLTFRAVITVPAYFNENSRIIIKEAAILAGFEVLKLINEPTAAALSYMNHFTLRENKNLPQIIDKNGQYLVYDLGGGTFDVSILKSHNNEFFRVIGIGGDKYLGGDDFDFLLACFFCQRSGIDFSNLPILVKNHLLLKTKRFKEDFDSGFFEKDEVFFEFYDPIFKDKKIKSFVNREIFDEILSDLIEKTITIMKKTLNEIDLSFEKLNGIILVGGSSRLRLIKIKINEILNSKGVRDKVKILDFLNPDEIVVSGAALYALNLNPILQNFDFDDDEHDSSDENKNEESFLSWRKNFKQYFVDAISQNLGIEVGTGVCEVLIPKNSPVPITAKQIFSTQIDGQKIVRISICQGGSSIFNENTFLGEFFLENLESDLRAGEIKIEVSFSIDCDGILAVFAKILNKDNAFFEGDKQNFKSYFVKIK